MAKKKGIDVDKYAAGLFTRTEQYADRVRRHYATAVEELLKLSAGRDLNGSGAFSFADSRRLSTKANKILRSLYSAVYQEIKGGVSAEWEYANLSADSLIGAMFGKKLREDDHLARWFSRNQEAMDAFFKRKSAYGGLNLSQKVWKYTGDLKTEMEVALSVCLGQGDSAAAVSRKVRKYLQEPDSMFRRFRVKTGEKDVLDGDGNKVGTESVYGRVWKRKVIDPQTGEVTWKTFNPKDYHSGRGVYRSSYKNAMRLTRTETNMAYRTAEQDRWRRMDFVLGYRVMLSNNHPCDDICNDLSAKNGDTVSKRGVYPKDFVFKGWHPQCRCVCTPILADEEDFVKMQQALLDGEEPATPQGMVRKPNEEFYSWVDANRKRIEKAQTVPYFVMDNRSAVSDALKAAAKEKAGIEVLIGKYNSVKARHIDNPLSGVLHVDVSAGLVPYASEGFTALINLYYQTRANIEKVAILKKIVEREQFSKLRYHSTRTNSIYAVNMGAFDKKLSEAEMPKNLLIAKKLVLNGYDVYLLSNPNTTRSADFILRKNRWLYYYEGKTLNGRNSLDHLLSKGVSQSDRIVIDIVGTKDARYIREMVVKAFQQSDVREIMLLKGARLIRIADGQTNKKDFAKSFDKLWNLRK